MRTWHACLCASVIEVVITVIEVREAEVEDSRALIPRGGIRATSCSPSPSFFLPSFIVLFLSIPTVVHLLHLDANARYSCTAINIARLNVRIVLNIVVTDVTIWIITADYGLLILEKNISRCRNLFAVVMRSFNNFFLKYLSFLLSLFSLLNSINFSFFFLSFFFREHHPSIHPQSTNGVRKEGEGKEQSVST